MVTSPNPLPPRGISTTLHAFNRFQIKVIEKTPDGDFISFHSVLVKCVICSSVVGVSDPYIQAMFSL